MTIFDHEQDGEPGASFSVWQFFNDGTCECVLRNANAQAAIDVYESHARSVQAIDGAIVRVAVTDAGDFIALEWTRTDGFKIET
jgi:hypothetical protein